MYQPTVASASSSLAHATMMIGASGRRFGLAAAAATCVLRSSSVTTMNLHGCRLSTDGARRAALKIAWIFFSGTGIGLNLLALFHDLIASRTSIISWPFGFRGVIISLSGWFRSEAPRNL